MSRNGMPWSWRHHKHIALVVGEFLHGAREVSLKLSPDRPAIRVRIPRCHTFHHGRAFVCADRVEALMPPKRHFSPMVDTYIPSDTVEPRRELGFALELSGPLHNFQKNVLCEVSCTVWVRVERKMYEYIGSCTAGAEARTRSALPHKTSPGAPRRFLSCLAPKERLEGRHTMKV